MTERQLHKQVCAFLTRCVGGDVLWHHSPNETTSFKGREAGVLKGFPDLFLSWRDAYDQGRTGFIELKAPGKSPGPEQRFVLHKLKEHGSYVSVCTTLEEVEGVLAAWGVPVKGKVFA